jgi:peroxiredoxin
MLQISILAGSVSISGVNREYAGIEIVLLKYGDQISGAETILTRTQVSSDGSFSLSFDISETEIVFAYLGIYRVHLFAESGQNYEVILPPRQDKQPGDLLNPYFEPVIVHLALKEFKKEELNTQIRMFNDAFIPFYNKHIVALSKKEDFSELDKNIKQMEKSFSKSKNTFFNDYRRYKYGLLRHLAWQHRSKHISNEYFRNQPVKPRNPAYMELFNQVYDKYLHHFSRTSQGDNLGAAIRSQDFDSLKTLLGSDEVLGGGDLPVLVLLKSIHDEFYDDNYSRSMLLSLLDDYIEDSSDPVLHACAVSIRNEVTKLLTGFEPPAFELYDKDSNLVKLEDMRGKYIYLNFCSCFSYTCMNEFQMLSSIYDKHHEILEIVTVIVDNDPQVLTSFLERSNYPWKFLHYANQSTIIRQYDIRAFPTYYLIDREGKLALSPAPSPGEEFEARLFKIMRGRGEL